MFNRIKVAAKRFVLGVRYNLCSWGLNPYNGRTTDQLNFQEKWRVLEIIDEMHELDEQLAEVLREAGDLDGLIVLQQNIDMTCKVENEIKRSLLSVV